MKKLLFLLLCLSLKAHAEVEPVLIRTLTEVTGGGLSVTGSTVAVNVLHIATITYGGISQPNFLTQVATTTFGGVAQPVTFTQVSTVTFNDVTQPVKILNSTVPVVQGSIDAWLTRDNFDSSSNTAPPTFSFIFLNIASTTSAFCCNSLNLPDVPSIF